MSKDSIRPIHIAVLALLILAGAYLFVSSAPVTQKLRETVMREQPLEQDAQMAQLPESWTELEVKESNVLYKAEKQTQEGITPTVVLVQSSYAGGDPDSYVDELKAGAARTLPSLKYSSDSATDQAGYHIRYVKASYEKGTSTVGIIQRIYVSMESMDVYTVTASFPQDTYDKLKDEIDLAVRASVSHIDQELL